MLAILIGLLAATLVTGVVVGLLARMSPKEIVVQLLVMAAAGGFMYGLVGLLWIGG